jgi:L-alanine-DL-glutamate epimerase-like enolase superfamily enzyme
MEDPFGREREAVVLRVADDAGAVGWGEASPLTGYSPDALDEVEAGLDDWAARWERGEIGETDDVGDDPALDDAVARLPSARCAIDTALFDLAARRLGVPLHARLLDFGRPERPVRRVPVAALASLPGIARPGTPPGVGMATVADAVAGGYRTVKLKIGGDGGSEEAFARELEALAEIRSAFPYLRLRLDVNGAWESDAARTRLAELARHIEPELVEQPVDARAMLDFGPAPVPLAGDESVREPGAVERLAGACVAVVLKPMVLGGPRACLRLAESAFAEGMQVIVSHTFGGPVAHAAACELALALAALDPASVPPAAGLAGHDELPQRAGPWIVPAGVDGHGVEGPW